MGFADAYSAFVDGAVGEFDEGVGEEDGSFYQCLLSCCAGLLFYCCL